MDFTLRQYAELLKELKNRGYIFYRFADYASAEELKHPHVLLRHDVDRLPGRSMKMGEVEHELGAVATYFFRIVPASFRPSIMSALAGLGHEIGFHYEELSDTKGDAKAAWELFQKNIKAFKPFGELRSIAMHGRPFSAWDNRDLWQHYDYKTLGIEIEAYRDIDWSQYAYFTDVGRSWNHSLNRRDHATGARQIEGASQVTSTEELRALLEKDSGNLIISTHPERWSDSPLGWLQVLGTDAAINVAKAALRRGT